MEALSIYRPGDVFAGKYRIDGVLGSGGMGVVLAASHIALGERVAIKVLHHAEAANAQNVSRLVREARAAARLKGEHGVRILDVATLHDGVPFIVMEHLAGEDLAQIIEQSGPMPVKLAVDYVLQACEALAEAHAGGIVHRDVKPSNVFVARRADGSACVKVLDFGISKLTSPLDATTPDFNMTQTREAMGTPQYMAPEQMRSSRKVDARVDIWGLGTLLFVCLAGREPFEATAMPELCAMILEDPTPSLSALRADVPVGLDAAVQKCLMKRPSDRPQSALELARMLVPFASPSMSDVPARIERVLQQRLGAPPSSQSDPVASFDAAATIRDIATPRRRIFGIRLTALGIVALVLAFAGAGAFIVGRRRASTRTTETRLVDPTAPAASTMTTADPSPSLAPASDNAPSTTGVVEAPVVPVTATASAGVARAPARANHPRTATTTKAPPDDTGKAAPPPPATAKPAAPSATATSRFD